MTDISVRKKTPLTQDRLLELVNYDPLTGLFTVRKRRQGSKPIGSVLGTPVGDAKYLVLCIDYRLHYLHRLAFFYMLGRWPNSEGDHENGNRQDNRWVNLREADRGEQMQNLSMKSNNTSGFPGVHPNKSRTRWMAEIRVAGIKHYLGTFDTPAAAHAAYVAAKARLHTFNPTVRLSALAQTG